MHLVLDLNVGTVQKEANNLDQRGQVKSRKQHTAFKRFTLEPATYFMITSTITGTKKKGAPYFSFFFSLYKYGLKNVDSSLHILIIWHLSERWKRIFEPWTIVRAMASQM